MMRLLLPSLFMVLTLSVSLAAPNNNPLMRACRLELGSFLILEGQGGPFVMCFLGNSGLGAETLFNFKAQMGEGSAIGAYKGEIAKDAVLVTGTTTDGRAFELYKFADGSLISKSALDAGPGAAINAKLDQALSSTY